MDISIVIPVFNEEKSLKSIVNELQQVLPQAEIIVVDDKSTDNSLEIAKQTGARVFSHKYNQGYGAAIKTGIKRAKHENIGIIDADATYSPKDFLKLLKYVPDYDMVVGAREKSGVPAVRKPAKWFLKKLASYLVGFKIPDLNSGLRIFKKDLAEKFLPILPSSFSLTSTITLAMFSESRDVKYVPISYSKREGKSKIKPIQDTLNFLQLIVRVILYFNPFKIFLPLSLIIFAGALILGVYSFFFTPKFMDVTFVLLCATALQTFFFGLIADLINKRGR